MSIPLDARYRVMKKLSVLLCIFLLSACAPSEVPSYTLVERNGIKYEGISQIPFTGVSTEYYENGQLKNKSTNKDGEPSGRASYYENGQLNEKITLKDGSGTVERYLDNGRLWITATYKDEELNGLNEVYYQNGQLEYQQTYKDGELNGLVERYYENGQLYYQQTYKDGAQNGLGETYFKNGQLKYKMNYKDGEQNGLWKYYHENGDEEHWSPVCYQNGKKVDISKCK